MRLAFHRGKNFEVGIFASIVEATDSLTKPIHEHNDRAHIAVDIDEFCYIKLTSSLPEHFK